MKATGIIRPIDSLGRVVLPMELRNTMNISSQDTLQITINGEYIVLRKFHPSCVFCNNITDVVEYKGKSVCKACMKNLKTLVK